VSARAVRLVLTCTAGVLFLFVAATAVVLALAHYQPQRIAPLLEVWASAYLGRQVRLGELSALKLGRVSYVQVRDIGVANASWTDTPEMGRADRILLRLDLPSLWGEGPIQVKDVEVDGLRLDLQVRDDLAPNWRFLFSDDASDEEDPDSEDVPFPVVIEHAAMRDIRIRYRDPDQDVQTEIFELAVSLREDGDYTDLLVHGEVNALPLRAEGFVGPAQALRDGQNLALEFSLGLGDMRLNAAGSVADALTLAGADFDLQVSAPRSRKLLDLLGLQEVRDGPMRFSGRLADANPGVLVNAEGFLADFDLQADGVIRRPVEADGIDLGFHLDGPSMLEAGELLGVSGLKDVAYELSGRVTRNGSLLQLDEGVLRVAQGELRLSGALPQFPDIDDWRAVVAGRGLDLSILGPMLGLQDLPQRLCDIDGQLSADDDGLELVDFVLDSGAMKLTINGVIGELPDFQGTRMKASFAGDDMSSLERILGTDKLPSEAFELSGALTRTGEHWRLQDATLNSTHVLASLDAELDRLVDPQSIDGKLELRFSDLASTLAAYGLETEVPPGIPLYLSSAAKQVAGGFEFSGIEGDLAGVEFSGAGLLSAAQNWAGSRIALQTKGQNLRMAVNSWTTQLLPEEAFQLALDATYHAPLVVVDHLDFQVGGHQLQAQLALGEDKGAPAYVNGKARVAGDSLLQLLRWAGVEAELVDSDYQLSSDIHISARGIELETLDIRADRSDLSGALELAFGDVPRLDMKLHSRNLFLLGLIPDKSELAANDQVQEVAATSSPKLAPPTRAQLADRIIPDSPLPTSWINRVNGRWQYSVESIFLREGLGSAVELDLDIRDGMLRTDKLEWDGSVSRGIAQLTLDASASANEFSFSMASDRIPVLWLLVGEKLPRQQAVYKLVLSGRGKTLRELAGSLDGAVASRGGGGLVNNQGLDLVLGDVLGSALDRLNPYTETEEFTEVICFAGAATLDDGVVALAPGAVLRTDRVDLLVSGQLDLGTEALNVAFNSRARKGIGISAGKVITPYLKLVGNLAHPYVTVNPESAVVSGTAALATAGLSVIAQGMWDRWVATAKDPCEVLVKQAREGKRINALLQHETGGNPNAVR
jgi:AsmA family protein